MPIKLKAPRKGKSPNWSMRGTHLRVYVDESCRTPKRSVARAIRDERERAIERGDYPPREAPPRGEQPTFLSAAVAYLEAGKRKRYVKKLIRYFGEKPLSEFSQDVISAAAIALHPTATGATRNAMVFTPVSAILHRALGDVLPFQIKRPVGAKGRILSDWLTPADADAIITAAETFDAELALLLRFLLYTGVRLNEALRLEWDDLYFEERDAWMRRSKGGPTGAIKLRDDLGAALMAHRDTCARRRVFRFHQGGHMKHLLVRAKLKALGLPCPVRRPTGWKQPPNRLKWVTFHSWRHTWATWMRRYGRVDLKGLVATGNWRDERSAARYAHAVAAEEWDRVADLPAIGGRGKSVDSA